MTGSTHTFTQHVHEIVLKAFGTGHRGRGRGRSVIACASGRVVDTGLLSEHFGQEHGVTSRSHWLLLLLLLVLLRRRGRGQRRRRLGRVRQPFRVPFGGRVRRLLFRLLLLVVTDFVTVGRMVYDHLYLRQRGCCIGPCHGHRPLMFVDRGDHRLVLVVFLCTADRHPPTATADDPTVAVGRRTVVDVVIRVDRAADVVTVEIVGAGVPDIRFSVDPLHHQPTVRPDRRQRRRRKRRVRLRAVAGATVHRRPRDSGDQYDRGARPPHRRAVVLQENVLRAAVVVVTGLVCCRCRALRSRCRRGTEAVRRH